MLEETAAGRRFKTLLVTIFAVAALLLDSHEGGFRGISLESQRSLTVW